MGLKKNQENYRSPEQLKKEKFENLVQDLMIEFTVGGDRFDVTDIDNMIQVYNFDREALYARLVEEAQKVNADSISRGLGEILPRDFFIAQTNYWLFYMLEDKYEPVQREDGKWNIQTKSSHKLLSPEMWFDSISSIDNGVFCVSRDEGYESNILLSNGKLLSPVWFDRCMNFYDGYLVVEKDNREWYVDRTNKSLTGDVTFKECRSFYNGIGVVTNDDDMKQIINLKGELSIKKFEEVYAFRGESAIAKDGGKYYLIDKHSNRLNGISIDESWVTALPTVHQVAKNIGGEIRWNLMHDNGDVLLPGWPKKLKILRDSYVGMPKIRQAMYAVVDDKYEFTVFKDGKVDLSADLNSYLKSQPKVSIRRLYSEKKSKLKR